MGVSCLSACPSGRGRRRWKEIQFVPLSASGSDGGEEVRDGQHVEWVDEDDLGTGRSVLSVVSFV